jgi:opacity protein-like surface antigen
MTKKIISIFFAALLSFVAKNSYAECDGFYLASRIGQAKINVEDDRGVDEGASSTISKKRLMLSGAIGYRHEHWRAELEYIWRKKNSKNLGGITDVDFKSQSFMFMVYYDFLPYTWFTPYVNAGFGYTRNKLNLSIPLVGAKYDVKGNNLAWSLGAGISAKVTNRLNVDAGYRYLDMGDLDTLNGKTETTDHEVYMGVRYVL